MLYHDWTVIHFDDKSIDFLYELHNFVDTFPWFGYASKYFLLIAMNGCRYFPMIKLWFTLILNRLSYLKYFEYDGNQTWFPNSYRLEASIGTQQLASHFVDWGCVSVGPVWSGLQLAYLGSCYTWLCPLIWSYGHVRLCVPMGKEYVTGCLTDYGWLEWADSSVDIYTQRFTTLSVSSLGQAVSK